MVFSPQRFIEGTLLLDGHLFFRSFAQVGQKVLEWKECRPVVRKKYPGRYFQGQSDRSTYKPSIWFTRYSDEDNLSHDARLSQRANAVGTKTGEGRCRPTTLANQKLLGEGKRPVHGV
ncbi:hypothetical protein TNCV_3683861 [Trichonephila clavipes]|nr:hypothetical protein TNCV_3683861 [Trichonephila clavipes]